MLRLRTLRNSAYQCVAYVRGMESCHNLYVMNLVCWPGGVGACCGDGVALGEVCSIYMGSANRRKVLPESCAFSGFS